MRRIENLPGANRHTRPLWAEFVFALDSWLRRREGVFEYCHKPDCIFRAQLSRLSSDVLLSDGTFGRPGDRVIDLHLWNEQIPAMPIAGYSLAWGCRFNRSFEKSLGELAQSLVNKPDISIIRANTNLEPLHRIRAIETMPPNFVRLDTTLPDIARLVTAMVQARDAVERQSWWHPQEPTSDEWWADVLADPSARRRERRADLAVKQAFYRLADEKRDTILVACGKCEWRAAFSRDDLIATHGADHPMPNLLDRLAAPDCPRLGSNWDRCGVHYVEPISS